MREIEPIPQEAEIPTETSEVDIRTNGEGAESGDATFEPTEFQEPVVPELGARPDDPVIHSPS